MTGLPVSSGVVIVRPPDGGWGWAVVFASLMIHIIADGITYNFGTLYVELLDHFKESKSFTSWIGSILVGVTLGVGPISSALVNKYDCRTVTIIGSVLASSGCILSMFANKIVFLFFSFGFLTGFGFGLIYLPAIVSVTYYFEKRRAFATGIAVCGSGFGTFIFAPLTTSLMERYAWRGALLILSGLILNCIAFGALMRPLTVSNSTKRVRLTSETEPDSRLNVAIKIDDIYEPHGIFSGELKNRPISNGKMANGFNNFQTSSLLGIPNAPIHRSMSSALNVWAEQGNFGTKDTDSVSLGPMYRKDIFYSGSLLNIPQFKSNPDLYVASITSLSYPLPPEKEWKLIKCLHCSRAVADAFHQMMDFSLLKDPIFLLYAVSNFLTSLGFYVPYVYISDRGRDLHMSQNETSNLVLIIGIANTISRVILGYISDKKFINRLFLYNAVLTVCGVTTALSVFCTTFVTLGGYAAIFGATAGAYVSLTSVILVDLLGLDKLTNSFGLLLLFQGAASLIGPPIAGWLYDVTGNYDSSFLVMGSVIAISGFMLFFIPCIQSKKSFEINNEDTVHKIPSEYLQIAQMETAL